VRSVARAVTDSAGSFYAGPALRYPVDRRGAAGSARKWRSKPVDWRGRRWHG
jgi:hypothetical protein